MTTESRAVQGVFFALVVMASLAVIGLGTQGIEAGQSLGGSFLIAVGVATIALSILELIRNQ